MAQPIAPRLERPFLVGALVLSGAAPILALTSVTLLSAHEHAAPAARALVAYGAVVVGFLGGLRWGVELGRAPTAPHPLRLACAATATVAGSAALLLPTRAALLFLLATAPVQLVWDLRATQSGYLPEWMAPLRVAAAALSGLCLATVAATLPTP